MTERPTPDLRILETRVYRGANVWSYERAIHLVVDLGVLEQYPSNLLPDFTDHLVQMLPGLREHSCSRGRRGGFVERLHEGTWLGHVAEQPAGHPLDHRAVDAGQRCLRDPGVAGHVASRGLAWLCQGDTGRESRVTVSRR